MNHRAAGVAIVAALAACTGPADRPAARSDTLPAQPAIAFTDPGGRAVVLRTLPVRRIVSTMQSATEWVVALGAESLLVARTDFDRQPQLAHLPSIGGGLQPSPEAIAALHPDVIIGWRNASSENLRTALAPLDIPVISLETTDTTDVFHNLARVGKLVGREARADSLAASLRAGIAAAAAQCDAALPVESAFIVLWSDPPQTAGSGTWMHQLLPYACLRNAFADVTAPWPTISMEAITARQPRWIITSSGIERGQRIREFRSRAGWRDLDAVQAGRVIEVPGDLFARPGPTLPQTVRALVAGRTAGQR